MSVARFAVTRRVSVAMLSAAIVALGLFAAPRLAVALLPSFAPPVVTVSVAYSNASPETIETSVTRPIENAVSRVSGVDILESNSYQGQSTVRVQFDFGTDINVAAVDVQQQIARIRASLPNDPALQEPQVIKADPNATAVLALQVTDPARTQRDLSDLIVNELSDELASVRGVGSVGVSGVTQRAITIEPDEHRLASVGLTLDSLIARIKNENVNLPAGVIKIGPNEYGIRTNALYKAPTEIADTIVTNSNGTLIRLRDVARVSDSIQEQRIFSRLNGSPSVLVTITAQPDANVVAVASGITAKIGEIRQRYPNIKFATMLDQREFILTALASLEHTAMYGAILAVLVILLFLHSWRATLIVAVSLPVSILGTLFVAYVFHESLNVITLGGIALAVGLIVDDAVVVVENISRFLRTGMPPAEAAEGATTQILGAVVASSATVVTVFFPLLLIPGLQGLIFGPFAIVVMSGVAISFVVAITAVPMLSAELLRRNVGTATDEEKPVAVSRRSFGDAFDRMYGRFESGYRSVLAFCLDRPLAVLGSAAALLVITLIVLQSGVVSTEIFPPSDSRFVQFDLQTPNGTALAITNRISRTVEDAFRRDPRVVAVGATIGQAGFGNNTRSITNRGSLQVTLTPGTSARDAAAFVQEWRTRLSGHGGGGSQNRAAPGTETSPAQRAEGDALRRAMVGTIARGQTIDIVQRQISQGQTALELEIFGPDINRLQTISDGVMAAIAKIPGVGDPDKNVTNSQPEVNVTIDRTRLMMSGLGTGDLAQFISTATNGSIASFYQINGIQYPIIIELAPNQRRSFASLQSLELGSGAAAAGTGAATGSTTNGKIASPPLTLGSIADLTTGFGPSAISREDRQRRIEISAPISGRPLGPIVADAGQVMRNFPLPAGYRWEYGPEIQHGQTSFNSLWLVVGLAVVLIYMLLAAQFESYIDPLVIILAVPLSLVGIVASLVVTGRAFGLTAFIGSLMLVGIAVKNAILVIEFTKQLREEGVEPREALLHAGPMRLRPILMTTLATIGGMLPLAIGIEAGSSTQAPLATVVIGGLIASTFLSLLVVPTLYLLIARRSKGRFVSRRNVPSTTAALRSPGGTMVS
ncbi:MAG: efflux RND transporter permease subunit [Candidatus Eremiobacteraeota bacterium]|nr:efflux RND transporter permease subunit [Candidatus Eremiobacteraeota bacterium]